MAETPRPWQVGADICKAIGIDPGIVAEVTVTSNARAGLEVRLVVWPDPAALGVALQNIPATVRRLRLISETNGDTLATFEPEPEAAEV